MESKFSIDFVELMFLAESVIPERPIARSMCFDSFSEVHYHKMSESQRKQFFEHVQKCYGFTLENEQCRHFFARFNPKNQYLVSCFHNGKAETIQCYMRPSAVEARNEAKEDLEQLHQDYADTLDFLKEQILYELPYKIGDEIFYINRIVVKDTHEWRGNRSVKVRYEQVLRFEAVKDVIREINFDKPKSEPTTENAKNLIYFNNGVRINALHNNYQEAVDLAIQKTKADEEGRAFASMCR